MPSSNRILGSWTFSSLEVFMHDRIQHVVLEIKEVWYLLSGGCFYHQSSVSQISALLQRIFTEKR